MSSTSVDLPEPETPVTTTNKPSGNATSMFFRLLARAPMTLMALPFGERRTFGTGMRALPEM